MTNLWIIFVVLLVLSVVLVFAIFGAFEWRDRQRADFGSTTARRLGFISNESSGKTTANSSKERKAQDSKTKTKPIILSETISTKKGSTR